MASFPALFGGSVALYPLVAVRRRPVRVLEFSDMTEQRWAEGASLARFQLRLDDIDLTAKTSILNFFVSTKGAFDATWDITVDGTLYQHMAFDEDTLACQERENGLWMLAFTVVQVRKN